MSQAYITDGFDREARREKWIEIGSTGRPRRRATARRDWCGNPPPNRRSRCFCCFYRKLLANAIASPAENLDLRGCGDAQNSG